MSDLKNNPSIIIPQQKLLLPKIPQQKMLLPKILQQKIVTF